MVVLLALPCVGGRHQHIGVRDQLRWGGGGAEDFCPNILTGAPALENSLSGGWGGGEDLCTVQKKVPPSHINHGGLLYSCNTLSKRKNGHPNMKWFCPNMAN